MYRFQPIARCYYVHDHLYSPAALIDNSGNVCERYEYDAYGNPYVLEPNFADDPDGQSDYGNPYLFTGRRLDVLGNGNLRIYNYRHRYYDMYTGRLLQDDPLGINPGGGMMNPFSADLQYTNGLNLYEYVGSNPIIYVDPLGLWKVYRKGGSRAVAEAEKHGDECSDTIKTLAGAIRLNASEWRKWLVLTGRIRVVGGGLKTKYELTSSMVICPGQKVEVPNTAYIDVSSYSWGLLGWRLVLYKSRLHHAWTEEGLNVVYSGIWSTTKEMILSHLASDDIYKFAYIGHGAVGCLTAIRDHSDTIGIICPTQEGFTSYGIAEMHLIACETNERASLWKNNVSRRGLLRTCKGTLRGWRRFPFVDEQGE